MFYPKRESSSSKSISISRRQTRIIEQKKTICDTSDSPVTGESPVELKGEVGAAIPNSLAHKVGQI
jgi:hypothetical protein